MTAAAVKRTVSVGLVGVFTACTPAASPPSSPVDVPLEVPPISADASANTKSSGVRFHRVPSTVGSTWHVSVEAESHTEDPQGGEQLSTYRSEYDVAVLGVDGGAPSRVKLAFQTNVYGYQYADKPTAVHGRSYIVDVEVPHVRDAQGAAPTEEETERVLDVFPDLGTRTRIDEMLPDDAMQIGERRDELAPAVLRVIHPRAWTLISGSASLAAADAELARFDVTLDASSQSRVHMKVTGGAWVRMRDARLVRLELDGTYDHGAGTTGAFKLRRSVSDR